MLLSLEVEVPEDVWSKSHRAYFVWEFGKPPDVVIEVVSNKEDHEADSKIVEYASIGVKYYAIFDPERLLSGRQVRLYELHGTSYVERASLWMPGVDPGLCLWEGDYEGLPAMWLRWCDQQERPIETGAEQAEKERQRADLESDRANDECERADQERERADQERERADQERERAEQERRRADKMASKLRELGMDPDEFSL